MSRIEQAIEKAARLRKEGDVVHPLPEWSERPQDRDQLLRAEPIPIASPYLVATNGHVAAEEYRKLKSLLLRLNPREQTGKTLAVTSAVAEEGKSITSLNLALALAQDYDHTVLLVDTDLRHPSLHRYLGLKPEVGLVHCLKEGKDLGKVLIKTGLGKLVLLPAGGTVDDPVEHFASGRMKDLIREMKHRYPDRYVIFDTPPALPFADAQVLAAALDGVIFVVREGHARPQQVKQALEGLKDANLLGTVFNDVSSGPGAGSYYSYYR
jgi:exopolysaccharide/PEP-CTERM locus tyrosine autokinase